MNTRSLPTPSEATSRGRTEKAPQPAEGEPSTRSRPSVIAGRLMRQEPLCTHESLSVLQTPFRFDRSKSERAIGHVPRPFVDSVRDIYAWFDAAGMLAKR